MKTHEVFPTLVVQDRIDVHEEFKEQHFEELKSLWYKPNSRGEWTHQTPENSGRCSLHLNPDYLRFFQSLKRSVCKYLDACSKHISYSLFKISSSFIGVE